MLGLNGYLLFLALLVAAIVFFVIGWPWLGSASIAGMAATFAGFPFDFSTPRSER